MVFDIAVNFHCIKPDADGSGVDLIGIGVIVIFINIVIVAMRTGASNSGIIFRRRCRDTVHMARGCHTDIAVIQKQSRARMIALSADAVSGRGHITVSVGKRAARRRAT